MGEDDGRINTDDKRGHRCSIMIYRRILSVLLIVGLAIGLVSCQQMANSTPDVPIHLTFWHGVNPPPNREVLQRLVDRFNQNQSEIEVEPLYVGQGDQQIPKILAAVVGNAPPDLLWYAPMLTGQLVELQAIRPLEDLLANSAIAADIDPALYASMDFEDHLWSVPFGVNNVGLFYRPSLFADAGIQKLPRTGDDLRRVAQQLTTGDRHGILLPLGKGEWTVFMWLAFLESADGYLTNPDSGTLELSNPGAIAALELWQHLVEDGSAILSQPERGYELDQFLAGNVAMQLTGPWTLGELRATGVDFAVMPIPILHHPGTSSGGENLFIFNTTPEREQAAFTFLDYMLSESVQTQWALETGYLPVTVRSRQSQTYQEFVAEHPAVQVFLDQAPYGRSRPIFPGYNRVSDQLGRAIESVLLGQKQPAEALALAQSRLK